MEEKHSVYIPVEDEPPDVIGKVELQEQEFFMRDSVISIVVVIFNLWRACTARVTVCVSISVCLSICSYSRTTGF